MTRNLARASTAFLLALTTFLGAAPTVHAEAQDYEAQTDASGDPMPFGLPAPAPTSTPLTSALDLTEFGIAEEDELGLKLYFKVVNFKGDPTQSIISGTYFLIQARLEGTNTYYGLEWYASLPGALDSASGVQDANVRFCVYPNHEEDQPLFFSECYPQLVSATVDYDGNRFEALITKDALMGRAPAEGAGTLVNAPVITQGSRLSEIYVESSGNFPTFFQDRLPNEEYTTPYVFLHEAANTRIRLSLDAGVTSPDAGGDAGGGDDRVEPSIEPAASNRVSVTPGVPSLVGLRIENLVAAKRLVNLSATVQGGEGANLWSLQILPTIQVPSGQSRVVNLIVNLSAKAQHRDEAVAIVRGESLGVVGEIGAIRLELVASAPPSPQQKTLYFHAAEREDAGLFAEAVCSVVPCFSDLTWLNTLDEDPAADLDAGTRMTLTSVGGAGGFSTGYSVEFGLDTPLATALVLDPAQSVKAQLAFKPSVEFPAQLYFEVSTAVSGRVIASQSASVTVKEGAPIALTLPPMPDATRIEPSDGPLVARITLRPPLAGPGAAALLPTFMFVPAQSQIELPIVPDPNAGTISLAAGPAFVSLSPESDLEAFLNPGRAKLFNATVVNEGIEADDAQLEVIYDDPDWRVQLLPGARFHLPAGDGAKFSILVHAPENATEGQQLHFIVNATSVADPRAQSQLRFTAIVTTSIEIADESHYYQEDTESSGKVVPTAARNTPGFEGVLLALSIVAVTFAFRRKK